MADSQKTWAEIQALIADNTTLDISAQDQRDALISMRPNVGNIYQLGNGTQTTISDSANFFTVALSGTTLSGLEYLMDSPVSGRLRYTGVKTRTFLVVASLSVLAVGGATLPTALGFELQKNGVTGSVAGSENRAALYNAGMATNVGVQGLLSLGTNDYVEVAVRNTSYIENVLVQYFNLKALGFVA